MIKFPKLLLCLLLSLYNVIPMYSTTNKYRLVITSRTNNPATSVTLCMNQVNGTNPVIYYDTVDHGVNWSNYTNSITPYRSQIHKAMYNSFTEFTNLQPNTAYYFVIRDSNSTSQRYWFKTAPANNDRISIIAGSDSRNNRVPRQNANRMVAKLKPHAILFGGDMTDNNTDSQWSNWLDDWQLTIADDNRMFPIIPARGNHENSNEDIYQLFDTASTAYYAVTFGNNLLRAYTLNSENTAGGSQLNWLLQDAFMNSNTVWKTAHYHKPMRPHTDDKSNGDDEYNNWATLFRDNNFKFVFESDSHMVKTTWPVVPCSGGGGCDEGFIRDDTNGTVYVGEGCWGAPLRSNDDDKNWTRASGSFNHFNWVFIDEYRVEMRTILTDNVNNVTAVDNNDVFSIPSALNIWNPANGEVVEIFNQNLVAVAPEVEFSNLSNSQSIPALPNANIDVTITQNAQFVTSVAFYVNDVLINTDTSAPYQTTHTFQEGINTIRALATSSNGAYDDETITISVGDFSETLNVPIIMSNDDAEEADDTSDLRFTSSDLEFAHDDNWTFFGTMQTVGLRFQNLVIPKESQIVNAYIQFYPEGNSSGSLDLRIAAHDTADAAPFDSDRGITTPSRTSEIQWNNVPSWNSNNPNINARTPNIGSLVQGIVNKSTWQPGNSMNFLVWSPNDDDDIRLAYTFDEDQSKVARLIIEFMVNGNCTCVNPNQN